MLDQITTTDYWRTRHEAYAPGWWTRHYWEDWRTAGRQALAEAMVQCGPFRSVLEVGCGPGPNLRLWRSLWPSALLFGIDLNAEAVAFAQGQFAADPLTAVIEADVFDCRALPGVDLIVACGMLTTVEPGRIWPLLRLLWASVQIGVVFCELIGRAEYPAGRTDGPTPRWRHDYEGLLAGLRPPPGRWAMAPVSTLGADADAEWLVAACKAA